MTLYHPEHTTVRGKIPSTHGICHMDHSGPWGYKWSLRPFGGAHPAIEPTAPILALLHHAQDIVSKRPAEVFKSFDGTVPVTSTGLVTAE